MSKSNNFTDRYKMVHIFVDYFYYLCFMFVFVILCSLVITCCERAIILALLCVCDDLLCLSLSHYRCPGSGMVHDCIDS